jgi:hypothetical protein
MSDARWGDPREWVCHVAQTRDINSACGARFQSSPSGHDSSAPHNIASGCALMLRVNERTPDSRSRGLSSTPRLEDPASLRAAFTEAHARPCLGPTRRR